MTDHSDVPSTHTIGLMNPIPPSYRPPFATTVPSSKPGKLLTSAASETSGMGGAAVLVWAKVAVAIVAVSAKATATLLRMFMSGFLGCSVMLGRVLGRPVI
ncbi:hypothetical protein [Microvirga lotononidis]|uniref:hypothetical protein n=1 Tax=Microvirga lotononidis TaxID=864069 RepID=UPI0012B5AD22|nr:hypothetical protein [Microvirga lotononidis]WQO26512.1 hypothetical protein U0023_17730 [Microvirga lotononidis]